MHRILDDLQQTASRSAGIAAALPAVVAAQSKLSELLKLFKLAYARAMILSARPRKAATVPASRSRSPAAATVMKSGSAEGSSPEAPHVQKPSAPLLPSLPSPDKVTQLLADDQDPVIKLSKEAVGVIAAVRDRILPQIDTLNRTWKDAEISRAMGLVDRLTDHRAVQRSFSRHQSLPDFLAWSPAINILCPLLLDFAEASSQLTRIHARAVAILAIASPSNVHQTEPHMTDVGTDIAIVTVIPEEYAAVHRLLQSPTVDSGTAELPNLFGWETGSVARSQGGSYRIALALAARAGNVTCSQAIIETVERWNPRYVLLLGIAGGLPKSELSLGDVVISSVIYGYEYGKVEHKFIPRHNWIYHPDDALFASALRFSTIDASWTARLNITAETGPPKAVPGVVASGEKVVDDPTSAFFREVVTSFPSAKAVEMEGVGAATAIDVLRAKGRSVGFIMIRGISDLPRPPEERPVTPELHESSQTRERDATKVFAAQSAASFAMRWISEGWPTPPKSRPPQMAESHGTSSIAENRTTTAMPASSALGTSRATRSEQDPLPPHDRPMEVVTTSPNTIHEADASNMLLDWFERLPDKERRGLIRFSNVDEQLALPSGTAKRLLRHAVSERYEVLNEGDATIMLRRRSVPPTGWDFKSREG